jgi:1-acyl-sn-glycerol-3-phosphate acyltransferase
MTTIDMRPDTASACEDVRDRAPSAEEIERRFSSPIMRTARPMVLAGVGALKLGLRFGWDAHFEYNLHRLHGPVVLAANHRSHVDTAAILGTLPKRWRSKTAVAAALDVFGPDTNNGMRRRVGKDLLQFVVGAGFHAFAFDRFGPPLRSVRTSVQLIRNGWSLLLYPEGTRSKDAQINSFKAGVGLLARFTERPVIPIFVGGGEQVLPYGAFMLRAARIQVRYGSPMYYEAKDTPITFAARVEEQVRLLEHRAVETANAIGDRLATTPSKPAEIWTG